MRYSSKRVLDTGGLCLVAERKSSKVVATAIHTHTSRPKRSASRIYRVTQDTFLGYTGCSTTSRETEKAWIWNIWGTGGVALETKTCNVCGVEKPKTQEYFREPNRRRTCKDCYNASREYGVPKSQSESRCIARRAKIAIRECKAYPPLLVFFNSNSLMFSISVEGGGAMPRGWCVVAQIQPFGIKRPSRYLTTVEERAYTEIEKAWLDKC